VKVLGRGGMGCRDARRQKNGTPVAIKTLLPKSPSAKGLSRFMREIELVRSQAPEHV